MTSHHVTVVTYLFIIQEIKEKEKKSNQIKENKSKEKKIKIKYKGSSIPYHFRNLTLFSEAFLEVSSVITVLDNKT